MHGFDAMLFIHAETAKEWEELRHMRQSDAMAWIAGKRLDTS